MKIVPMDINHPSYGNDLLYKEHGLSIDILEMQLETIKKCEELARTRFLIKKFQKEHGYDL